MYMLEERILFDGAAAADVTEAEAQTEEQQAETEDTQPENQTTEQDSSDQQDSQPAADGEVVSEVPTGTTDPNDTLSELDAALDEILAQGNTSSDTPGVLIISSLIDDADTLAEAAKDNVIVVRYDAETTTLDQLLEQINDSLDGRKASSIGIAAHDYGDAKFYLTGTETISLGSTLASESQREFWTEMGDMLAENGRIDLFACGLASSDTGLMLVSSLENISGINFAASTDATGNLSAGGDWTLETDDVDLADTYFDKDRLDDFSGLLASEVKKLTASDAATDDWFGYSVSIDGDYAIVGAHDNDDAGTNSGSAYIFYKDQGGAGNWGEVKKLTASDAAANDYFGCSVSISGDYIVIGAGYNDDAGTNSGSAYIFYKDQGGAGNWGEVTKLIGSEIDANDHFGDKVSISGDYVIASAPSWVTDDAADTAGSAYIFYKDQGGADNWGELKKLTVSDAEAYDYFGCSVSISGDYAILGAWGNDDAGDSSGSAYIFYKDQGGADNWGELKKLTASDADSGDCFGLRVSISSDYAVVSASPSSAFQMSIYIFQRSSGWNELKEIYVGNEDAVSGQFFHGSVSVSGNYIVVGVGDDDNGLDNSGSAHIFYKDEGGVNNWGQITEVRASDSAENDWFGYSVSISGNTVLIGAYESGTSGNGSAYIFDLSNTPSVLANPGALSVDYVEGDAAIVSNSLTLTDADVNEQMASATIQITGNYQNGQDVLEFTNTANITGTWNAATGTLTLTGADTVANYQVALRAVKYENTSDDPNTAQRTVSFTVNDGDDNSNTVSRNIDITPTNDASVEAAIEGTALSFTEGDVATAITSTITLSDVDDTNLESATVQITGNYQNGQDVLSFTNTANITGTWNAATGTLSLTGTDTVANYQAALRSVKYQNTDNGNPSTLQRSVSFTVNDGDDNSNTVSRNIDITPANDAPVEAAIEGTTLNVTEGNATVITSTITLSDIDDTNFASATIQITGNYQNGQDVLSFTNTANITGAWNAATGTLTLTGADTVVNYQAALRAVKYENTSDDPNTAQRTVSFTVNDGDDNSNTVTRNIDITPANDASVEAAIEETALSFTEGDTATAITSTITLSDVDDTNLESATVQITGNYQNGQDVLSFTNTANITGTWNATTGTLTLTGADTVANYQAALRAVKYENTSDDPNTAQRTVSFTVNDGDDNSNTVARNIDITPTNDASVEAAIEGTALSFTEGDVATAITSTITLSDVDDTNLESATVQITGNYQNGQDVLEFTNTANITGTWNAATGTLTLTGADTLANYQAALRAVKYENTSDAPNTAQRTVSFRVNDGDLNSNTVTRNIDITPTNDAPCLNIENTALEYSFSSGEAKVISESLIVSDPDDTNIESATVQITGNYQNGEDVLEFTDTGSITGTWNVATGTLTLTGADTVANYQAALRTVTYTDISTTANTFQRTITFTVNDGDSNSTPGTRTIETVIENNNDGTEEDVPPNGVDDGTSNNGILDHSGDNGRDGQSGENQNRDQHQNGNGIFNIVENFRSNGVFSVVNDFSNRGNYRAVDNFASQGRLDLSNMLDDSSAPQQQQEPLNNGMPNGESGMMGDTLFNLPDGEALLDDSSEMQDEEEFAMFLGDSDCSRFADIGTVFEKHRLFKTDYEKALDELIAV